MYNTKDPLDNSFLFETSWEVCNKVGGIYTVLVSKAAELKKRFGDKLVFIGPDFGSTVKSASEFLERKTLLKSASTKLALPDGLSIRVGRWDIPGKPIAVLVDYKPLLVHMDEVFGEMWQSYGVDSLHEYGDYRESCAFAVASAKVMEALVAHLSLSQKDVLTHFNEWTTGMGLLYVKKNMPQSATIFTTHATAIGRSIASNGKELYRWFCHYDGDVMARELNMEAKHSLEKTAAHQADCFTTVSEVTAAECEQLLGIRPQVVTPNGFNSAFVPKGVKYKTARQDARERILALAAEKYGVEFGEDTFVVGTSGRNEYRNKGLDLFIDAMLILSKRNNDGEKKKVLAVIAVPAWSNPSSASSERFMTHELKDRDSDAIYHRLQSVVAMAEQGGVYFLYVPCYLDGNDGILNLRYYEALPAFDLTIFPSYYEPWGYTPLESVAFGVPTCTTSLSGFGLWATRFFENSLLASGVETVERDDSNYETCAGSLAQASQQAMNFSACESSEASANARKTASKASWELFIQYYYEAFRFALNKNR